jgi:hypothetical protein
MSISSVASPSLYPVALTNQSDPVTRDKITHDSGARDTKPPADTEIGGTPGHLNIKA